MFEAMRHTKKQFKKEFRQHKRNLKKLAADKLASNLLSNHPTDQFWKQVKLQSSTSSSNFSPTVNGVSGSKSIANMWGKHYYDLLNQKSDSCNQENAKFISDHLRNLESYVAIKKYLCAFELARYLAQKLKLNCTAGFDGLSTHRITSSHKVLFLHVSMFFNLCLMHNFMPNMCSFSVLTPIVKNKYDDVTATSNYCPIAS